MRTSGAVTAAFVVTTITASASADDPSSPPTADEPVVGTEESTVSKPSAKSPTTTPIDESRALPAWKPGDKPPPGYREASSIRTNLFVGGAVVLGIGYALSSVVAASSDRTNDEPTSYIPIAGAFAALGRHDVFGDLPVLGLPLLLGGLAQIGGAAAMVVAMLNPKKTLVRETSEDPSLRIKIAFGSAWLTREFW